MLSHQLYSISYSFRQHGPNGLYIQHHYLFSRFCKFFANAEYLLFVTFSHTELNFSSSSSSYAILLGYLRIVFLKRLVAWFFQRKINRNAIQLKKLRAEKKKILEQVTKGSLQCCLRNLKSLWRRPPTTSTDCNR